MFNLFRSSKLQQAEQDLVECDVCDADSILDGQMKEVDVDGAKVLVLKSNGVYHALGAKCSHFGASLANGVLCGDHVRCPWHGACFSIQTGDIEDFPGIDSIPKFDVEVVDGKLRVRAKKEILQQTRRPNSVVAIASRAQKNVSVLIIGAGPAATICAMTLRQEGFKGSIVLTSKEPHLPYDRSKLSKALSSTPEQLALRDEAYYESNDIKFQLRVEAKQVDTAEKRVQFSNGQELKYDKLVIATGCHARTMDVPGRELENIVTLRSVDDGQRIALLAEGKDVVIAGASFIGIEVAVSLAGKAMSVTVVAGGMQTPFETSLGRQVGDVVKKLLEAKDIKFHFKTTIKSYEGNSAGKLSGVVLTDGTRLPAELCVLGIGVIPSTAFLKDSGIDLSQQGHVIVDKRMQTNATDVYTVGDVTQFPLFLAGDQLANIQHWQMSHQHGRVCGLNLAGVATEIRSVPYFWTVICGKSIRYCGYGAGYDDIVIHGDLAELKFAAFYTKGDKVIAVASMNSDPIVSQAAEVFLRGLELTKPEVSSEKWSDCLKELSSRLQTSTQL